MNLMKEDLFCGQTIHAKVIMDKDNTKQQSGAAEQIKQPGDREKHILDEIWGTLSMYEMI